MSRAIELIEEKRERDNKKIVKTFEEEPELQILNGRWGPYISYQKGNYKIPKDTEATALSYEDCMKLVEAAPKKATPKKAATKKAAPKKAARSEEHTSELQSRPHLVCRLLLEK